ncbi:MAG: hypothetical protein D6683_13925, partial [Actinomyces sp.]
LASLCAHCHTQVHTGVIRLRRRTDGTWYPLRLHPGEKPVAPGGDRNRRRRGPPARGPGGGHSGHTAGWG